MGMSSEGYDGVIPKWVTNTKVNLGFDLGPNPQKRVLDLSEVRFHCYDTELASTFRESADWIWQAMEGFGISLSSNHVEIGGSFHPFFKSFETQVIKTDSRIILSDPGYSDPLGAQVINHICQDYPVSIDTKGMPDFKVPADMDDYNLYLMAVLNYLDMEDFRAFIERATSCWIADLPGRQNVPRHRNGLETYEQLKEVLSSQGFEPFWETRLISDEPESKLVAGVYVR